MCEIHFTMNTKFSCIHNTYYIFTYYDGDVYVYAAITWVNE